MRFLLVLVAALALAAHAAERLPGFDADARGTSASGISSGGYMAVQFHVAHSASVVGVGVLAGGPYYCAQGSLLTASYNCMEPSVWTLLPPVSLLKNETELLASSGRIDATSHLARAKVWLFSGTNDHTVDPAVVDALRLYYAQYLPASQIAFVKNVPAGHAMVTEDAGGACALTASPFINDCDFDAAGGLLAQIYGALAPPAAAPAGRLLKFDQKEFAGGDTYRISMADDGFVYVPPACESARCRIHVAFHGCRQSAEAIGEQFVREAGYNRWADTSGLIVLYPQTIARNGPGVAGWRWSYVFNPSGCWDWWGYTTALYHTRDGPQIRAVKAMVDRLASPRRQAAGPGVPAGR